MRIKNKKFLLIICSLFSLNSCMITKISPDYLDPLFSPANVDFITILPAVDIRKDRSINLGEDWEHEVIKKGVGMGWTPKVWFSKHFGYDIIIDNDFGGVNSINEDDLISADPIWIKKLGPKDARWILLFVLEDLITRKTVGSVLACECSAALYDKESGRAVWKQKAIREKGMGGVAGLVDKLMYDYEYTVRFCFYRNLIALQFPTESRHVIPRKAQ